MSITLKYITRSGDSFLFSHDDLAVAKAYVWTMSNQNKGQQYARATLYKKGSQKTVFFHKEVLRTRGINVPVGMKADHINRDKLDNRFENLRVVTENDNCHNRLYKNKTGYRGVNTTRWGAYRVSIAYKGVRKHLGFYYNPEDAARAYDKEALNIYGVHAVLNFPQANLNSAERVLKGENIYV